ncbi:PREDICTED: uncharacterized protein LOC105557743 [Vollenhovia emeryi]|uniref:uncharacterized protein LOC105557743 n=1 Tax=Vollenhovia emeryi TaxID=411798 RepID=UPI0005F585EC|nr:PREDICTED: uncharacterized protein LOC105557743 [Vollenhovia emeryi]
MLEFKETPFTKDNMSSSLKLEQRLRRLEKLLNKSEKFRITLKRNLIAANKRIKKLQDEIRSDKLKESLSRILNEDQIKLLTQEYKQMPHWCNQTLMNAYKLRFACGTAGYEEILKQKLPFPCIRTLTKKLENLKFNSGTVITEIFDYLKIKIAHFEKDLYKDCMIVLDEMSISPGRFYDISTNMFVSNVTLVGHDYTATATHALVIMLAGLGARVVVR